MVLGMDIANHRADADRRRRREVRRLDRDVVGRHLARIQGVFPHAVEPQQLGQAFAVQRVSGVRQYRGAHRAQVEAGVEFTDASPEEWRDAVT